MWLSWPVCNNSLCSTIWWGEQWIWWIPLDLRNSRTNWGPLSVTSYAAKRFMTGGCGGHFWLLLANLWICSPRMDHHNQCVAAAMVYPATSVGAMMLLPFTAHCSSVCRGLATTSTIGQQLSSVLLLGGRDVTPPGFGLLAFSLVSPKQTLDNSCFWLLGCLAILRMMLNNGSRLVAVWSHSVGTGNACNRPIRCEDPWGLTGSSKRDKASAFACWLGKFNGIDVCCQCQTPPLGSSSSHQHQVSSIEVLWTPYTMSERLTETVLHIFFLAGIPYFFRHCSTSSISLLHFGLLWEYHPGSRWHVPALTTQCPSNKAGADR
jgi:hypothetical protein